MFATEPISSELSNFDIVACKKIQLQYLDAILGDIPSSEAEFDNSCGKSKSHAKKSTKMHIFLCFLWYILTGPDLTLRWSVN